MNRLLPPPNFSRRRRHGVALVIVLALVALLTGLLVAFFSRSLTDRQIANSSAAGTRTRLLADGAVSTVLSDLKQEIAAGSNATTAGSATLFAPKTPASMIPATVGATGAVGTENLLKRSARGQAFYAGASNYDTGNFPPSNRAASVSSLSVSLNGRVVSPARWNAHLLLEKNSAQNASDTNDTDFTPVGATATTWAGAPDWVLVTRDGSAQTTWNTGLIASNGNSSAVVGRYAYQVFDEGGLLDANAAGYPSILPPATSPQAALPSYKGSTAFADLTQLPGIGCLSLARQNALRDALAGWRGYASAQASNTFPSYQFNANSMGAYYLLAANNPKGFLSAMSTTVNATDYQSDRLFASRQELLKLLLGGFASTDPGSPGKQERANLQNCLRFFTHYSRALQQPSYIPDPNRPKIVGDGTNNGGNNAYGLDLAKDPANNPYPINPSFPQVRAQGSGSNGYAFMRNDGSAASNGDLLVSKRFDLRRLAWLTYKGPMATSGGQISADPDIAILAKALQQNYGYTQDFLQQGTPANIYKYFGLSWVPDTRTNGDGQMKWFYNHAQANPSGSTGSSPITALGGSTTGGISHLDQLVGQREPDFVELLQATLNAGSKAKPSTVSAGNPNGIGSRTVAAGDVDDFNNQLDSRLDLAVLQVAANIIDQSDLDGYPTRILINNTSGAGVQKEVHGIENLPYINGLQNGLVEGGGVSGSPNTILPGLQPTFTTAGTTPSSPDTYYFSGTKPLTGATNSAAVTGTGFLVSLQYPEIWNPHDSNSPTCAIDPATGTYLADASGSPMFPINFRFVVEGTDPDHVIPATTTVTSISQLASGTYYYLRGDAQTSSGAGTYVWPYNADANTPSTSPPFDTVNSTRVYTNYTFFPLTAENTALTFTVPAGNATLFREPTKLMTPGLPANSNLAASGSLNMLNGSALYPNGIPNSSQYHPNIKNYLPITCPADGNAYLGVYLGTIPCLFHYAGNTTYPTEKIIVPSDLSNEGQSYQNGTFGGYETLRLQCKNGGGPWITYDEKYTYAAVRRTSELKYKETITPRASPASNVYTYVQTNGMLTQDGAGCRAIDPRAWRFGMPGTDIQSPFTSTTLVTNLASAPNWLDANNRVNVTSRPGTAAGYWTMYNTGGSGTSWQNTTSFVGSSIAVQMGWTMPAIQANFGLFSQNMSSDTPTSYDIPPNNANTPKQAEYYADADGVVRRAMGGYATGTATSGLPLVTAYLGGSSRTPQAQSRPIVLNRPLRNIGELGYVYSGTPWKNLDFFSVESGDAALLDVFSVGDTDSSSALVAGKVNLNTRQAPVLQSILNAAYTDDQSPGTAVLSAPDPANLAKALVNRTSSTPLQNVAELVGCYVSGSGSAAMYDGFSKDLSSVFAAGSLTGNVQRFREAPIRALSSVGQTRVWNLMIDVIAQTGRYPLTAGSAQNPLAAFVVEGEQHYWVHVAIDRFTGQVIDKQVEVVKE